MTEPTPTAPPTPKQYFTSPQFEWSLVIAAIAILTTSVPSFGAYFSGIASLPVTLGIVFGSVGASLTILAQGIKDAARNFAGNVQARDVTPNP